MFHVADDTQLHPHYKTVNEEAFDLQLTELSNTPKHQNVDVEILAGTSWSLFVVSYCQVHV